MSFGSKPKTPKLPDTVIKRQDKALQTERGAQDERMRLLRMARFGRTIFSDPGLGSKAPQVKAATLGGR